MKAAIILIHGYGGTPYEMEPIGRLSQKLGIYPIYAKLPGHCGNPYEMEGVKAEDWIEYILGVYSLAQKDFEKIFVAGLSMGALLAGILSAEKKTDGLILLAPSVYPKRSSFSLAPLAGFVKGKLIRIADYSLNPESNIFLPVSSVRQLWKTIRYFVKSIDNIKTETLIIQGTSDEMVRIESSLFVKKRLGSRSKLIFIPDASHVLPLDNKSEEVLKHIKEFLSCLL